MVHVSRNSTGVATRWVKYGIRPLKAGKGSVMGTTREDEQVARERRRRRAILLRELAEARELRKRVAPRRSRRERLHEALRMRTFRL